MAGCSQDSQYMGSQFPGGFPGGFPAGLFPGLCSGGLGGMIENFQPFLTSLLADNPQLMEELIKPISAVLVAATADSASAAPNQNQNSEKKVVEKTEKNELVLTSNKFQINLNIDGYTPGELSVKTADNFITIEGKHEEKSENSHASRSFSRRWPIPDGVKGEEIICNFNLTEGLLQLEAPRIVLGAEEPEKEKMIPIKIN